MTVLDRPGRDAPEEMEWLSASAAFAPVRAVEPAMKAAGLGRTVSLTALTLDGPWDGDVPYTASKGVLLGLASELDPHGVTVNAIAPSAIVSEAERRVSGDRLEAYEGWVLAHHLLRRRIEPGDVAALAVVLCSDDAPMISGRNLQVDGGS